MTAYGNDLAASVTSATRLPYPNGSIILMEFAEALQDSNGNHWWMIPGSRKRAPCVTWM